MKHLIYITTALLLLTSCNVTIEEGNDKEDETPIKNGFSYDEVNVLVNDQFDIENNTVPAGEILAYHFEGVENATKKGDYIHVGLEMKLLNGNGEEVVYTEDALANVEQQNPNNHSFMAYYTLPVDLKEGEEITCITRIFDKYGTVDYTIKDEYTITKKHSPSTENLDMVHTLKAEPSARVLVDSYQFKKAPVVIFSGEKLEIKLANIEGFTPNDQDEYDISYQLEAYSEDMQEKLFNMEDDLLIKASKVNGDLPLRASQKFSTDKDEMKYIWSVKFTDNVSGKSVHVKTPVTVKNNES